MKSTHRAIFTLAVSAILMSAVPTTAIAGGSSACEAANNLNTFEAWFYRTFLC